MKKLILPMLILFLMITGCAKYEDGPAISFKSKDKRIEGKWNVTWVSGGDATHVEYYEFTTSNAVESSFGGGDCVLTYDTASLSGTWEWLDNGDGIKVALINPNDSTTIEGFYNVLKLTKKEMVWNAIDRIDDPDFQTKFEKVE